MCGICGYLGLDDAGLIHRMCDVLAHRGPDDQGMFIDDGVGLGNRRLSIIDVEGGHQPIHNEDESVWITYNGEIYNFERLRGELSGAGHVFYTSSDTEVIVHAYEEYGWECVNKLDGMFAFGIWDSNKQRLMLARDRLGIKPLYYTMKDFGILFASEIKALLEYDEIEKRIDHRALDDFLTFRFVPGPRTILKGVMKLQPGHILLVKDEGSEEENYWSAHQTGRGKLLGQSSEAELLTILTESVKMRLRSDVPLGAYLSGGIDSSTIVGMMSQFLEQPVKTFSVGFGEGGDIDELEYARITAEHFGTDHHELLVGEKDAIDVLPEVVWHFDEPLADPAGIPTYLMSRFAKKHVTVVLTGEGADEMFGGYMQYRIIKDGEKYLGAIPRTIRHAVPKLVNIIPSRVLDTYFEYSSSLGQEAKNRFDAFARNIGDLRQSYLSLISLFTEDEKRELYTRELLDETLTNRRHRDTDNQFFAGIPGSSLQKVIVTEILTELPDDLLMKVDKMTSAWAVEARVPFLSHELVEFSLRLPDRLKLKGKTGKYILRKATRKMLPKPISRRKKHRFFVPIDHWFESSLKELSEHLLSRDTIKRRGYFRQEYIDRVFRRFENSSLYYSRQIWNLIILEIWHKIFIDVEHSKGSPRIDIWS